MFTEAERRIVRRYLFTSWNAEALARLSMLYDPEVSVVNITHIVSHDASGPRAWPRGLLWHSVARKMGAEIGNNEARLDVRPTEKK